MKKRPYSQIDSINNHQIELHSDGYQIYKKVIDIPQTIYHDIVCQANRKGKAIFNHNEIRLRINAAQGTIDDIDGVKDGEIHSGEMPAPGKLYHAPDIARNDGIRAAEPYIVHFALQDFG